MRFRVLGPVSVVPRTPTAGKVRVVLAVLLIRANETVSTECLIDELWDNSPPRTAATTLQVYISQLRRILAEGDPEGSPGGQRLLTVPPGYSLRVEDDEVDLIRFESRYQSGKEAYERGDFAEAASLLHEGLSLWSGPPLSGIPHGYTLSTAAVRLEELRMSALEQRITADLRLGRHKELTGELMALTNEYPLRETLHGHLMVALFRSGRQSDALRTFTRARKALIDELGIEPGAGLRHLHERILRADPNLAWRESPTARVSSAAPITHLPPALPDFVGREEAMAQALRSISESPRRILVLGGRTGVGKSAFAVELARRASAQLPHGSVFVSLRGDGGEPVGAEQAADRLAHLIETGSGGPPEPERSRTGTAEALTRLVRGRRMMVILDDAASEEQIRPVIAAIPGVFVVVTTRRALAGLDGARHLVLDPLSAEEAQALLKEIVGARIEQDPAAAREIARLCGYLPLGLRVAGAALAARPHWTAAAMAQRLDGETAGLAELVVGDLDVRHSLATGYEEADPTLRWAFRMLALAPSAGFSLWCAAAVLGRPQAEVERILDRLVQGYLLEVRQNATDHAPRYSYHRLQRALALELLAADDQDEVTAAVDRLCAASLALIRQADAELTPARVRYDLRFRRLGQDRAQHEATPIGPDPVLWFQEECAGLVEVVRRAHGAGLLRQVCLLAEGLAGYFETRAAWDDWTLTHELALDAARRTQDQAAEAEAVRSLGDLDWQQQRCRRAAERFDQARALALAAGDQVGAARSLIGLGDVTLSEGEPARAGKIFGDALARCEAEGDARGRADALRGLAVVELQNGRPERALDAFTEFAEAAELLGDRRWSRFARRTKVWILENAAKWADEGSWVPRAVEARPGVWVVGGDVD